ncbi:MAG: glycosyltransferase family 2 protein [Nitrospinae bacterium]|nr:glycosyltransferase family 2 protein [Nitrospinota bacterium]
MNSNELLNIPFDQYQRYRVLKDIVGIIKNQIENRPLKILDVGGHSMTMDGKPWLPIKSFLSDDKIWVLDVPQSLLSGYIRGSGNHLPFKRLSFQIISCQDVLEHIPKEMREPFLENLSDMSSRFIILGGPLYSENTVLAERILFEYIYKTMKGAHHQLREHLENGLPRSEEIEEWLTSKQMRYCKIPSGYLNNWLLMNLVKVYIASLPESLNIHTMIDRFFNLNFYESDQREPAYRYVYIIDKNGKDDTLDRIHSIFYKQSQKYKHMSLEKTDLSQFQLFFNLDNLETKRKLRELQEKEIQLQRRNQIQVQELKKAIKEKDVHIENLTKILDEIQGSKVWRALNILRKSNKGLKLLLNEGFGVVLQKIKLKYKFGYKTAQEFVSYEYEQWIKNHSVTVNDVKKIQKKIGRFKYKPTISIIMPVFNVDKVWLEKAIDSVLNQIYPSWELCIADDCSTKSHIREVLEYYKNRDSRIKIKYLTRNQGISLASNEAISLVTGEFIGLLDHDDELALDALYEVVKLLQEYPDADMIYSDEDKITSEGKRFNPFFKPDWSPDLFLSQMYTCHFGIYRKKLVDEIGGFKEGFDGSQDYDLVLRLTEKTDKIFHIPKMLYHWRTIPGSTAAEYSAKASDNASLRALSEALSRRSIRGNVEKGTYNSLFRVKRSLLVKPKISIIIPTKDQIEMLKDCVESILNKTDYQNYEIVIVENNSIQKDTIEYLDKLEIENRNIKVFHYARRFNFSAINNYAMGKIDSEVAVFLNNDIEVKSSEWLSAMVEHIQRKEVGAVGAKLLFPNDSIQHAGVILGIGGVAGHAFKGLHNNINQSYFGHADAIRNYSAVTGACLMIRKGIFEEIGGFDEVNLPIAFNDIDLCLRLRERGYLIIYTPYAVLYHYESSSRGYGVGPDPEAGYMIKKWKHKLYNDPYYNINLTLQREDFGIRTEVE